MAVHSIAGRLPVGSMPVEGNITEAEAAQLALTFARQFGPFNRSIYERAVGRSVNFNALTAHPRVLLTHSQYQPVSDLYSMPSRNALGSYYLVTLTEAERPVLSVAVSALAGDVQVLNGRLVPPKVYGNEFVMLPLWNGIEYPMSPESAVRLAAERTRRRVSELPVLLAPSAASRWAPQYAIWRVVLERGPGFDTAYVSWDGGVWESTAGGPHSASALLSAGLAPATVVLRLRPGVPTALRPYPMEGAQ